MLFVESIRYADIKIGLQDLLVHGARAQGRRYSSFRSELSTSFSVAEAYMALTENNNSFTAENTCNSEKSSLDSLS